MFWFGKIWKNLGSSRVVIILGSRALELELNPENLLSDHSLELLLFIYLLFFISRSGALLGIPAVSLQEASSSQG